MRRAPLYKQRVSGAAVRAAKRERMSMARTGEWGRRFAYRRRRWRFRDAWWCSTARRRWVLSVRDAVALVREDLHGMAKRLSTETLAKITGSMETAEALKRAVAGEAWA